MSEDSFYHFIQNFIRIFLERTDRVLLFEWKKHFLFEYQFEYAFICFRLHFFEVMRRFFASSKNSVLIVRSIWVNSQSVRKTLCLWCVWHEKCTYRARNEIAHSLSPSLPHSLSISHTHTHVEWRELENIVCVLMKEHRETLLRFLQE